MPNVESLRYIAPELFVAGFLLGMLVWGLVLRDAFENVFFAYGVGLAGLAAAFLVELWTCPQGQRELFMGMLRVDRLAHLFKLVFILSGMLFIGFAMYARETVRRFYHAFEYVLLTLVVTLGMMLLAGASNLLMVYLALEFVSFVSYLMVGFIDRDEKSNEAAVKYLLYGGTASGVMLFGMSLLFGLTGALDYPAMHAALVPGTVSSAALFMALVLILAGIGFKIAAVPFHQWCPDVYEGAPTPLTAFLSVGPKAAGFAMAVRFFFEVFATPGEGGMVELAGGVDWPMVLAVISALTMTFGNLAALQQRNIKRLLAYSSIAHAGYMLMALAAQSVFGISSLFFYMVVYLVMNLGAFLVVIVVSNEYSSEMIERYEGLGWTSPQGAFLATALTVFLFSLVGIPPFAGFVGKVYLLLAVFERGSALYWLAVVAVVNTIISLYYYARIVRLMFLSGGKKSVPLTGMNRGKYILYPVLGVMTALTVLLGVYWTPLDGLSRSIGAFLK